MKSAANVAQLWPSSNLQCPELRPLLDSLLNFIAQSGSKCCTGGASMPKPMRMPHPLLTHTETPMYISPHHKSNWNRYDRPPFSQNVRHFTPGPQIVKSLLRDQATTRRFEGMTVPNAPALEPCLPRFQLMMTLHVPSGCSQQI